MKLTAFALFAACLSAAHASPEEIWKITGKSMLPLVREQGDSIIVRHALFDQVRPGSIVTFKDPRSPAGYTSHAVISQVPGFPGCWVTKGINNPRPDPWYLSSRNYVGIVVAILAPGRYVPLDHGTN